MENKVVPQVDNKNKPLAPHTAIYDEIIPLMTILPKQMLFYYQGRKCVSCEYYHSVYNLMLKDHKA